MQIFLETLIQALVIGSLYALIALGYTMVYGILKFINFAHSDVFVLGAWSSYTVAVFLISRLALNPEEAPWWLGPVVLVSAMLICSAVGFTIERLAYRPLKKAPRLNVLITAIGVSLLMQNVGQLQYPIAPDLKIPFGTRPQPMPTLLPQRALNVTTLATGTAAPGAEGTIRLEAPVELDPERGYQIELTYRDAKMESLAVNLSGDKPTAVQDVTVFPAPEPERLTGATYRLRRDPLIPILLLDVVIVGSALLLMLALEMLVFRTKLGTAMRAVSFNFDTAALMGINVDRVISFTFVVGAALAGGAGFLNALKYPSLNISSHESWVLLGLKAFVAAVVGGIGNVRGAVLGGFLIAFIEFFGKAYINPALADVYVFSVLILVLLLRPSGILGSTVREKV